MSARTLLVIGGAAASLILVVFAIACIVVGIRGRDDVRDTLARENIVGTADSTIPGQLVDTGDEARAFADVMREHALSATGGKTYSEIERYVTEDGTPTNNADEAAQDNGEPRENPLRQLWITETALSTSLNTAYFAEQVGNFAIVMGIALLLTGIGFAVLTFGVLWRLNQLLATART